MPRLLAQPGANGDPGRVRFRWFLLPIAAAVLGLLVWPPGGPPPEPDANPPSTAVPSAPESPAAAAGAVATSSASEGPRTAAAMGLPVPLGPVSQLAGRVEHPNGDPATTHVLLLEFEDTTGLRVFHGAQGLDRVFDALDDDGVDLAAFDRAAFDIALGEVADVVATAVPAADGTFALTPERGVLFDRLLMLAIDPALRECAPPVAPRVPLTVLAFRPRQDLDVVVTADIVGVEFGVEWMDGERRLRPARSATTVNGVARFPGLVRGPGRFAVRCAEPPLYCASGPIDLQTVRFSLELALRTQRVTPCPSPTHADEVGGTIAPLVEHGNDSRSPGTAPLALPTTCPGCALLAAGTYMFRPRKPKYAFGSFPLPAVVRTDAAQVHILHEIDRRRREPNAWLSVR